MNVKDGVDFCHDLTIGRGRNMQLKREESEYGAGEYFSTRRVEQ